MDKPPKDQGKGYTADRSLQYREPKTPAPPPEKKDEPYREPKDPNAGKGK